jgi:hypothetical protein
MSEFETTAQGCRIATSVGGVLTWRGRHHHHRRPAEAGRSIVGRAPRGRQRIAVVLSATMAGADLALAQNRAAF